MTVLAYVCCIVLIPSYFLKAYQRAYHHQYPYHPYHLHACFAAFAARTEEDARILEEEVAVEGVVVEDWV